MNHNRKIENDDQKFYTNNVNVEIPEVEKTDSFRLISAENAYYLKGYFDHKAMIDGILEGFEVAKKTSYNGSHVCTEMNWALNDIHGSGRLLEYKVLVDTMNSSFSHLNMCQYDINLFDGATLLKVLQMHPYIIAHGQVVQQNPYYITPEDFLRNYKS